MPNQTKPENPLLNLAINIFIPVMVLNKGGKYLDPKWVLLVALLLPLGYGLNDYLKRRHKNYVSLFGVINILFTGGLALSGKQGLWFAVKEASLPAMLGLLVLASAWTSNPAAKFMFCNPQILNMDSITEKLKLLSFEEKFLDLLKRTSILLSISFFISSAMNFGLAVRIFTEIDTSVDVGIRDQILNEQIAKMTWMGYVVIALPLMFFTGALVYYFLRETAKLTSLPIGDLLKTSTESSHQTS